MQPNRDLATLQWWEVKHVALAGAASRGLTVLMARMAVVAFHRPKSPAKFPSWQSRRLPSQDHATSKLKMVKSFALDNATLVMRVAMDLLDVGA